jgi:hypothetical protein
MMHIIQAEPHILPVRPAGPNPVSAAFLIVPEGVADSLFRHSFVVRAEVINPPDVRRNRPLRVKVGLA